MDKANLSLDPQPVPTPQKNNLLYVLLAVFIILIGLVAVFLFIYFSYKNNQKAAYLPVNSPKPTPTQQSTHSVVYSVFTDYYSDRDNPEATPPATTIKFFKSYITGKLKQEIFFPQNQLNQLDQEYPELSLFLSKYLYSPNSKYVARYDGTKIAIASVNDLKSFQTIYTTPQTAEGSYPDIIHEILWFPDSQKLIFLVYKLGPNTPPEENNYKLFSVNRDGSQLQQIHSGVTSIDGKIFLKGIVGNKIYYLNDYINKEKISDVQYKTINNPKILTEVNLIDSTSRVILEDPVFTDFYQTILFTSDFLKAYYAKSDSENAFANKIIEYDLSTKQQKVLYVSDLPNSYTASNSASILLALVTPDNRSLIFDKSKQIGKGLERQASIQSLDLKTGTVKTILDSPQYARVFPRSISPDGRYIWFSSIRDTLRTQSAENKTEYFVMDINASKMNLIESEPYDPQSGTNIEFIGWIKN